MKRIIRLFEGYYHLQALFVLAEKMDKGKISFVSTDALLIDAETGVPLDQDIKRTVGYEPGGAAEEREDELCIRDELAIIAHLMRGRQYSPEEVACMNERAQGIMGMLAEIGLDVSEEFPQVFELDEIEAARLRRANRLN